jgi:hypothetical protein
MMGAVCSPTKYRKSTHLVLSRGDREWLVCLVRVPCFSHLSRSRGRSYCSCLTVLQAPEREGSARKAYACAVLRSPHPKQTP